MFKLSTRRDLLRLGAVAGLTSISSPFIGRVALGQNSQSLDNPFRLGVASGSPRSDGFVLWTRVAPDPLSTDTEMIGGMHGGSVAVSYEIAADSRMKDIVRRGTVLADASFAYSVHLEVDGLQAGRNYWYQFRIDDAFSRVGRAITLPAEGHNLNSLRIGFVSCSNYETGYFSAYRHLADEQPDIAIFLGDYIYEGLFQRGPKVRSHSDGVPATTLATYRNRHAQYKLDPDLQRLHAEVPSIITWDDHEVQNDYADKWSETFDDPQNFLIRRAAAYQAYYEHMPLRPSLSRLIGSTMRIHDRFKFGSLAEFSVLDGRQYRSREACYEPPKKGGGHLETRSGCAELFATDRTMLGQAQEDWLFDGLARSQSQWNFLAQDVLMARFRQGMDSNEYAYWTDVWDGYPESRSRLMNHLRETKVRNPVVMSGDIHSFWANDLKLNADDDKSPVVATELVGTSVSSPGPNYELYSKYVPNNPHVKFFESRMRGYVFLEISEKQVDVHFRTVSDVTNPESTVSTLMNYTIEDGRPGVLPA